MRGERASAVTEPAARLARVTRVVSCLLLGTACAACAGATPSAASNPSDSDAFSTNPGTSQSAASSPPTGAPAGSASAGRGSAEGDAQLAGRVRVGDPGDINSTPKTGGSSGAGMARDGGRAEDASAPDKADGTMPPAAGQLICRRRIDLRGEPAHNTSGSFFRAEFAAGGHFVAADAAGNIVIVGSFLGLVDFGAGELDTKGADWALFVAKFDGSCRPLWSRSFGSPGARIEGAPLAIDGEGAIVVAGALFGSADFGGAEETSASSHYNAYVLKLSADGDTLWSKVLESQGLSYAYSVAVDASDDVVITGEGEADTDFDDATLGTGGPFAAELSPSGKHLWTTRLPSALEGSWVSTSTAGDVMLTSALAGPVDWADGTASIPGSGEHSVLSQLSAAGVHRFSKAVHEGGAGWGFGFAPASGDRFILTYDLPAATQTSDRRAADTLAADGTLLSSRAWDGAAGTRTQAVALDASGNAIELGVFAGSVTFGATTLTSIASEDVYLAKRDQYGALVWASHEPSEMQRENVGLGVDVDSNDNTLAFWLGRESDGEAGDELMLVKLAP